MTCNAKWIVNTVTWKYCYQNFASGDRISSTTLYMHTCCKFLNDIKAGFRKYILSCKSVFTEGSHQTLLRVVRNIKKRMSEVATFHTETLFFQLTQICFCSPEERSYCWRGRYHKVVLNADHYHHMALAWDNCQRNKFIRSWTLILMQTLLKVIIITALMPSW